MNAQASADTRPRVLAVDDDRISLNAIHGLLREHFRLMVATSGAQGLAAARSARPDLILLDVTMPDMDGFETCARLREDPVIRDIPVVFLTGHDDPAQEVRALQMGAVDFLLKPLDPLLLGPRIEAHLRTGTSFGAMGEALAALGRSGSLDHGDLGAALAAVAASGQTALGGADCSIWRLEHGQGRLTCVHPPGHAAFLPATAVLAALEPTGTLALDHGGSALAEAFGATGASASHALLAATVWWRGQPWGLVLLRQPGARRWRAADSWCARALADAVARALSAAGGA